MRRVLLRWMQSSVFISGILFWSNSVATPASQGEGLDLTTSWTGVGALVVFAIAYVLVIVEEFSHLRKSKPVLVAAGVIWVLVGVAYQSHGDTHSAGEMLRHNILEYAELFLFLLAAMTYVNTLDERNIFKLLRVWLVSSGLSLRSIFWITGLLAFLISPIADNLTTALVMCAVILAVGVGNISFISVACINIVVAANAGGAFSPFGDITTLMVWQKGLVQFSQFFYLVAPSLVNWLVPALIMSFTIGADKPQAIQEDVSVKRGGYLVIALFLTTIIMAVSFHSYLHLPPVLGMMTGLGLLKIFGYRLRRAELSHEKQYADGPQQLDIEQSQLLKNYKPRHRPFDIFISMKRAEWDTLMFFYGVILSVGGLGAMGYLALVSQAVYVDLGPTVANILVGFLSAIVDNIPVMFAVLTMNPDMSLGQWLLVTLTAGVGGSLLSIGSAAGVALMGQARGYYTFFRHLKWSWAIALGYAASIWVHLLINERLMNLPIST